VDDIGVVLAEEGLAGGPDAEGILQLFAAAQGDPGALRGKAGDMVLLLLQQRLRDQHREIHVLVAGLLEPPVQFRLDILPDGVAIGAVDEHTLDGGVVNQLRFLADVGIPLGKIRVPGGDGVHLSLILCHMFPFLYNILLFQPVEFLLNFYCIHFLPDCQLRRRIVVLSFMPRRCRLLRALSYLFISFIWQKDKMEKCKAMC
jgi:hypothetical protein